ncbi:MAG: hypothetical protein LBL24_01015 [Bacteroidales bacterium]|nr:hypothetical protein [Bacteroidales bacterium]
MTVKSDIIHYYGVFPGSVEAPGTAVPKGKSQLSRSSFFVLRSSLLILFLAACHMPPLACQIPVGTWRDHLSWTAAEAVAIAGSKIYCSNGVGLCIYDIPSRSLDKLTKVNGLNDAGITAMQYAAAINVVVAGYVNGNLDIVAGSAVYNIPGIKQSGRYADKRINHIYVSGTNAYISCCFGIVMVDLQLRQIRDTYIIGDSGSPAEVFSLAEFNGYFYATTAQGLKKADSRSRLLTDFSVWEKMDDTPGSTLMQAVSTDNYLYARDRDNRLFVYDGFTWKSLPVPYTIETIHRLTVSGNSLLVSASNAVFIYSTTANSIQNTIQSYDGTPVAAYDAALDSNGSCWIADNNRGLVQWQLASNAISCHLPNGPASNHAAALRFKADRLLAASGGRDEDGMPLNRPGEIHTFYANNWSSISPPDAYDFTDVDVFENQPSTYYVTSWGKGLYVFENGVKKTQYTQNNSTLVADYLGNVLCGGLLIDADDKLWVSNDKQASLFGAGQWKALPWQVTSSLGRFTGDNYSQVWTTQGYNGLLVFSKTLSEQGQSGASISFKPYNYNGTALINRSNQISGTPDGIIWAGTTQGPVYYKNPAAILSGEGTAGAHPLRTGTDEPSHTYALLGSENVLSVAIDGAYRKWFGTETAGVFLVAEDNVSEVKHFTVDNSPLFSNKVHDIAINDRTGEVFFATDYGIVAYRGDAVSSGEDFGRVYAFPNPVRPEYQGEITITGLIRDADVKITDVAGNLVYQTRTLGGQAVWNGRNRQGRRVATGVYLVFCTNSDGSKTHVTKILFVH